MNTWTFANGLGLVFKTDADAPMFYDLGSASWPTPPLMPPRDRALAIALLRHALKELEAQDV